MFYPKDYSVKKINNSSSNLSSFEFRSRASETRFIVLK